MLNRKGVEEEELKPILESIERINKAVEEFKILSTQEKVLIQESSDKLRD